ncbi:MAG: ABC transporter substrate-binding protein [Halodesulfurarchaeum sp.]
MAFAGCTGGDDADSTDEGTTTSEEVGETTEDSPTKLSISQKKAPIEFDPAKSNDVPSLQVVQRVHESLYTFDDATGIQPKMTTGEPEVSKEGTRWVVELRDDIAFQNGDPVTAEDVKYSYTVPVEEETDNAGEFEMIDSINIVDDRTVQFDLANPFAPFKTKLAWQVSPKSVREEDKQSFNKGGTVGAGPYKLSDWEENEYVKLTRWEDYWDPQPDVDELELVPVKEATTRMTTLKNDTHDVVQGVPPDLYSSIEDIEDATIEEELGLGYYYLAFNCAEGPTSDPTVREAIDYSFSMDQAVENYIEPAGNRLYAPVPQAISETWDFPTDEWEQIPHEKDIEKAEELFDEAGISRDYEWKIITPPDEKREQIGISVSNGLKAAGFSTVSVERLEWGTFNETYNTGNESDYNMYTLGWLDEFDPHQFLYFLFHESQETVTNGVFYDNPDLMEDLEEAGKLVDKDERNQLYTDVITTVLEDRVHLPAYNLKNTMGVQDHVNDLQAHTVSQMNPRMISSYNNVSVDK